MTSKKDLSRWNLLRKHWLETTMISRRDFSIVFTLLFNALTWFYMTMSTIDSVVKDTRVAPAVWTMYYIATFSSGIVGSAFSNKIERINFLYFWMTLGVVSPLSLALAKDLSIVNLSVSSLLLGISLGLGMPSALSYFADSTLIENRGRIGSFIFLAANLSVVPMAIFVTGLSLMTNSLILIVWRSLGLITFALLKPTDKTPKESNKNSSFLSVFRDRSLILYLLPWFMFTFIDRALRPFFGPNLLEAIIGGVAVLIGGFLCDTIGRKRVVVYGFVLLGIAYAIVGIVPFIEASRYLYSVLDGFAAGMLMITFVLTLWGDLSKTGTKEKYYAIGSIPLFATNLVPVFLSTYILQISASAVFSVASFFLFLAVLPLMYAPETLPEKKIRLRQLQSYAEKAKKLREKYLKKSGVAA